MKGPSEKHTDSCEQFAFAGTTGERPDLCHQVTAMYRILCDLLGTDRWY